MSSRLAFWKMNGAGNDFVVVDGRAELPVPLEELARTLCRRRFGAGADGLLVVGPSEGGRVAVDYRNADGSPAGFCGNGARCAARFAVEAGLAPSPLAISFPALELTARVDGRRVEIEVPRPRLAGGLELGVAGQGALAAALVEAGVPHAVVRTEDAPPPGLDAVRDALAAARPDLAGRVNITTVEARVGGRLHVRTLERGSGETLACGSAALAAVALEPEAAAGLRRVVVPPAGVELVVRLDPEPGPAFLDGDALLVYRGVVELPIESA